MAADLPAPASRPDRSSVAVSIRSMTLDDLPKVYALGEHLFTAEKWPALYRTWDEYEVAEFFTSDSDFCLVAIAEQDEEEMNAGEEFEEEVVGFCLGTLLEKRHSAWSYGYLVWMGVDSELKGRGIGRRLLSHLTDLFVENGARMMLVDTAGDNEGALSFFRSQGFGHELEHVYLSRNLDKHPKAVKRRRAAQSPEKRPSSRGQRTGPKPTEINTPSVIDPSQLDQTPPSA